MDISSTKSDWKEKLIASLRAKSQEQIGKMLLERKVLLRKLDEAALQEKLSQLKAKLSEQ